MFGVWSARVRFGDRVAVDGVTLALRPGSVTAVVGGDGAGKSTLLRALVREVPLDRGTVVAPDKDRLGFLPASSGSWGALTVAQNVDFVGGVYGLAGSDLSARRTELLDAAGLSATADRLASQLSGGMRRKLGFCMAMVHKPDLLVLDEPSTGVDPVSRIDLWRLVSEAAAGGATVVMSTTYLDEAERAAELLVLDRGRALVQGSYDEVRSTFPGTITRGGPVSRPEWSWRRGRERQEYWPDSDHGTGHAPEQAAEQKSGRSVVEPDLEDIVIALSLSARNSRPAA
jgi:ABC-2 type transport system ATP-binding protein